MSTPILQVKSLVKEYKKIIGRGKTRVLNSLSFEMDLGDIFALVGPNGAGKTTLIKSILNIIPATSGEILINGEKLTRTGKHQQIGYVSEESALYPFLSGLETLQFYGKLSGLKGTALIERCHHILNLVGLKEFIYVRVHYYSKGMRQRLNLAQALLHDPEFYILDEPVSGLDPLARVEIRSILLDLKRKGKTIFFSSHELSEVEIIADKIGFLSEGKLIHVGPLSELLQERDKGKESLEQFYVRLIQEK